ncbi:TPA: hypothetical protein RSU77_001952 [Staphylococcus aureus]|nr:Hypothetical protein SaO17_02574 [Staphylococcus aureus]AZH11182.1 Hypothetical protein SaO267_02703 [Staphylococcus aureus]MBH4645294.1 hypothetical protein [Staphylococcus aureus]MBH4647803.1 hypothetical protein [Staphylococcus aureus]MBH4650839.1 hypothetical protein [Staphylococcus aureus]
MRTNNHITDLDAIELSSAWNYNSKLITGKNVNVNNHVYRVIDKVEPTNTGLGYKLYERYDNDKSRMLHY